MSFKSFAFILFFASFALFSQTNTETGATVTDVPGQVVPISEKTYNSDTVEVVSEKGKTILSKYGVSEVISDKELKSAPDEGLPEIIDENTSAYIMTHGQGQSPSLFLQGFGSSRNLVLLDGEPLMFPQLGLFDLNQFPCEALSGAELVSGGASALYGQGALGGALDLFIDPTMQERDYSRISANWGSFNTRRLSGIFKKRLTRRIGFGATASELDGDLHRETGTVFSRDFSLLTWAGYSDFDLRVFGSRHEGKNYSLNPVDSTGYSYPPGLLADDSRIYDGKLSYKTGLLNLSLRYTHQDYDQKYWFAPEMAEYYSQHKAFTDGAGATLKLDKTVLGNFELNGSMRKHTLKSTDSGDHALDEYGGKAQMEYIFKNGYSILGAVRADRGITGENFFSPIVAIKIPYREYNFFASGRIAYKTPTINDLYWARSVWGTDVMKGNPNLTVEKSIGGEAGFDFNSENSVGFSITAKGFYQQATDLIEWLNVDFYDSVYYPDSSVYAPVNISEARIYGVNTKFEYRPDTTFFINGFYTFTNAKGKRDGEDTLKSLPKSPKHTFGASIGETRFYLDNQLSLTLKLSGKGIFGIPDAQRTGELEPVGIFNCRLDAHFLSFTIFGNYYYAISKTTNGWKNVPYELDPGYTLPESEWRTGIYWEFLD